jgi:hypothetical protein
MKAIGDTESVNLSTGVCAQRVVGDGESLLMEHGPFALMAGCPWNVLDSRGVRIAICGGDSNADWERFGPPIAAAIVEALNAAHRKPSIPPGPGGKGGTA